MAKKKNNKKSVSKFRLTIFNDATLEEISTFRLNKYIIFVVSGITILVIATLVALLLIYSPMNMLIPSRANTKLQTNIIENSLQIDTLQRKVDTEKKYLIQLKNILQGKIPEDTFSDLKIFKNKGINAKDLNFSTSDLDSIVKAQIEQEENERLAKIENVSSVTNLKNIHFVVPLKGMISGDFDMKKNHLAIDIVGNTGDAVLATLPGTVVIATWTSETGYVIGIQHDNNLLSFYKHNSVLLKKLGDRVVAGESIALVGNSGETTTGTHLHFELWFNGSPVNPKDYIAF